MSEITNENLPWDAEDAAIFAGFLQTVTGRRLVPKLFENAPVLLDGADVNKTLVRNGEFRGFSEAVRNFLSLQTVVPETKSDTHESYPSPENDSAWNDGQTLQPK